MTAKLHDEFVLYQGKDTLVLDPIQALSAGPGMGRKCLWIDRNTSQITEQYGVLGEHVAPRLKIFGCLGWVKLLAGHYLVLAQDREYVGTLSGHAIWRITKIKLLRVANSMTVLGARERADEEQYMRLLRLTLDSEEGSLYTSYSSDITRHSALHSNSTSPWQQPISEFLWNSTLVEPFLFESLSLYMIPVMHGFLSITSLKVNGSSIDFALISRRSRHRAGTRYTRRGVDAEGHAANYVETEQVIQCGERITSYLQVRGSIPVFFHQYIDLKYTPTAVYGRPGHDHINAFAKHVDMLVNSYGPRVVAVNLVNKKKWEMEVSELYSAMCERYDSSNLRYHHFDFHHECKGMKYENLSRLTAIVNEDIEGQGFYAEAPKSSGTGRKVEGSQKGVFRTNCIDSLDRTNVVQSLFAKLSLTKQLRFLRILSENEEIESTPLESVFKNVWADNADTLSNQYTGTPAMKTDYTRTGKRGIKGALKDLRSSLTRYYLNNFSDGSRQDGLDLALGIYKPSTSITSPFGGELTRAAFVKVLLLLVMLLWLFIVAVLFAPSGWGMKRRGVAEILALSLLVSVLIQMRANGRKLVCLPRLSDETARAPNLLKKKN